MLERELCRGKQNWRLIVGLWNGSCVDQKGTEIELRVSGSPQFQSELKKRLKGGWKETERSLSLRSFVQGKPEPTRYWKISVDVDTVVTESGKVGDGRPATVRENKKYFDSADEAVLYYFRQIAKKQKDGYHEYESRTNSWSEPPEHLQPRLAGRSSRKTTQKSAARATKKTAKTSAENHEVEPNGRREFTFEEGSSRKFWNIERDGTSHTVQYGRLGTNGQTKTKDFPTEEKAKQSYDKLIAEKLKKGYVEAAAQSDSAGAGTPAKKSSPAKAKKSSPAKRKAAAAATVAAAQPVAEPAAVPEPTPPPVVTEVTHFIDFSPVDAFRAMWQDPDPLPLPEPRSFDLEACLESVRSAKGRGRQYSLPYPEGGVLSPQEAEFWLEAQNLQRTHRSPRALFDTLSTMTFSGQRTIRELVKLHKQKDFLNYGFLVHLLSPEDYLELLLALPWVDKHAAECFRDRILPYLSRKQRRSMQQQIAEAARTAVVPKKFSSDFSVAFYLAAVLGCHETVEWILALNVPSGHWFSKMYFIWGLGSAERVEEEVDRLRSEKQLWWNPDPLRSWLVHTGTSRLDVVGAAILSCTKGSASNYAEVLELVRDPLAAPIMLEIRQAGKAPEVASRWLDEQLGNAVTGLVPVAAGNGKLADAARGYLREKQRQGFGEVIERALKDVSAADALRLRETALNVPVAGPPLDEKTTPKKLRSLFDSAAELAPLKGSEWLDQSKLPPLLVGKGQLNPEQLESLVLALQHSESGEVHPLVEEIAGTADAESAAEFAWSLFEAWLGADAPSRHKWAMRALGLLGNDETAQKLTPLVRAWPGESQHPRAVLGLECLRAIGSSVALMQLSGIAQKVKFKGLQRKAMECVEQIAAEQGMTRDELEDRVVPDCGLDENGTRVFDFGERQFTFALNAENKPVVRDADGKLKKDLPKPANKDDQEKAALAVAEWKALKKQIRDVVKVQTVRLEQALITGRRWKVQDFQTLLVQHPLMTNFVRRLLWAGFDAKSKRKVTFRVTDERDFADAEDASIDLAGCESVGLVHPLHLNETERAQWGELFSDYEIVPPFVQLGRPVHQLSAAEKKANSFARFEGLKVPALTLLGILNRNGWTRGMPQDNGVFMEHYKHFFAAELTAVVTYENGIAMGMYGEEEDQTISGCFLVPGIYQPDGWPNHKRQVRLGTVDPVVISEVTTDLIELEAKAV
ncbi:MAG: DUF4132 domain-containing protein [Planctomycetaceae bacterium]|nr:DUF4132 domain-containing protein [Planctomycetaceae bacterium]